MLIACFAYLWLTILLVIPFLPNDTPEVNTGVIDGYQSVRSKLDITVASTDSRDNEGNTLITMNFINNSPYTVSGEVLITLLDAEKKIISQNLIPFDQAASTTFFAPSWLPAQGMTSLVKEVFIKDVTCPLTADARAFEAVTNLPVDETATQTLRSYMQQYFGGAKPTSWYGMIDTITVFRQGTERIAVVKTKLASGGNKTDALNGLQSSIIGFAANSANRSLTIIRVEVFDSEKNRIASRVNPAF